MNQSAFDVIGPEIWKLRADLSVGRRDLLLHGPSFETIVGTMADELKVVAVSRNRASANRSFFRATITLRLGSSTVDLFHNSATGYRAQYYSSPEAGERANMYVVNTLATRIIKMLERSPKRTCPPNWVALSLRNEAAKVWIHQGRWLRNAKASDGVLFVPRWINERHASDPVRRKRARWSVLAPDNECRVDVKGAYLQLDGASLGTLKPTRPNDIHELGFT
jgi:hypothetical protein